MKTQKEFTSKLTRAKRERKFLTVFSNFWVDFPSKCEEILYIWMTFISKLTRAKRERKFLTFFKLLSGFSFKMLGNPLYLNDIYLQIDAREARKKIFDCFFKLLRGFSLKILIWMTFITKSTRTKRERNFLTLFSIFWVDLLQNVGKSPT